MEEFRLPVQRGPDPPGQPLLGCHPARPLGWLGPRQSEDKVTATWDVAGSPAASHSGPAANSVGITQKRGDSDPLSTPLMKEDSQVDPCSLGVF